MQPIADVSRMLETIGNDVAQWGPGDAVPAADGGAVWGAHRGWPALVPQPGQPRTRHPLTI